MLGFGFRPWTVFSAQRVEGNLVPKAVVSVAAVLLTTLLSGPAALADVDVEADLEVDVEAAEETDSLTYDDAIVVSAHRFETPAREVGSSVTVLTADDIARHHWPTVAEALRSVPGVEVARTGGPGQSTSVFVRGGSSSQTLVLLDGVRLNSSTTGAFDFADLSTDGVERIEIVRGPQSTLYGSEAAAGVVSIVTRRGVGRFGVSGEVELGEEDHHRARIQLAGSVDGTGSRGFDYLVSVSDQATEGVSTADARRGNPELDAWESTTALASLGWTLGDTGRLDFDLRHVDSEVEIDGFAFPAGPVDDPDALNRRAATTVGASVDLQIGTRWTQTVRVGLADDELAGEDPGNPFGTFVLDSRSVELGTQADVLLSDAEAEAEQVLSVGASWEDREGGTVGSFDEDAEIASIYVQDRMRRGPVALTVGARHDDHSQFGGETTWRLAASVAVGGGTSPAGRLHASAGTGFKAPTINDLFFPGFSNPELRPETSRAIDLGYEHRFGRRSSVDVTAFDMEFGDLIAFDFVTFLPQNIASATSRGVEARLDLRGDRVDLGVSHTWNETEDEASGLPLARRPEHRTVVDLAWRLGGAWSTGATWMAVADRIDSDLSQLEDYERLDWTLEWQNGRWRPYVRVLNLLDEEYSEVGGYGAQGRTAMVGLVVGR